MGQMGSYETSVLNHLKPRNNAEDEIIQLPLGNGGCVCAWARSNDSGRTFVPSQLHDASVSVAGDNKVYSSLIQSIKEKLWGQENCKLNGSTGLAFARSTHNMSVEINHWKFSVPFCRPAF